MLSSSTAPLRTQLLIVVTVLLASPTARAERRLTLEQAVDLALKQNPELRLVQARVDEAASSRKSARGLWGPQLRVEGNVFVWDSALKFDLGLPDTSDPNALDDILARFPEDQRQQAGLTLMKYSDLFGVMVPLFDLGNIRDQVTAQVTVTLAQPLTQLLQVNAGHTATQRLEQAAMLDQAGKRAHVAAEVRKAYLQLMQASRFEKIARTGVAQVEAHLKQARHFHAAGLIGKQDVLKAQLELARARERVIKARYGVSLARSALARHLGLSLDARVVPTEKVADPPPAFGNSLRQCVRTALEQRTDLKATRKRHEAAEAGRSRAKWALLPELTAAANYQFTEGQGTFFPRNAFFVGGILTWEVWDWGKKYYEMQAAGHKARQAELGQRLLRDGIQLQTKKAYLDLKQSEEALEVARTAITEARENYRIETKRYEANAATTTDVLDAQLALTRAELTYTTSLYGHYIARAELKRAMGAL